MKLNLGLKASSDLTQIQDRLAYRPDVFEFFTSENDFSQEGLKNLAQAIKLVKQTTPNIVLHHPMRFGEYFTELVAPATQFPKLYHFIEKSSHDLLQLAFDYDIQVLIHGSYSRQTQTFIDLYPDFETARAVVFKRILKFQELGQTHIMFENSISNLFYYGDPQEEADILATHCRLAFDTSHCFIKCAGDNAKLLASLKNLQKNIVHYHLVDSLGKTHDSLPLGKGKIDWPAVLPLLNPQATSIYEINLANQNDALEQIQSHQYLTSLLKRKEY